MRKWIALKLFLVKHTKKISLGVDGRAVLDLTLEKKGVKMRNYIYLAQETDYDRVLVNAVLNLRAHKPRDLLGITIHNAGKTVISAT